MREKWEQIIDTCRSLSRETRIKLPAVFDKQPKSGQPMGKNFADPVIYNQMMLDGLAGFLAEVDRSLAKQSKPVKKADE